MDLREEIDKIFAEEGSRKLVGEVRELIARALWCLDCRRADQDEKRENRVPRAWADPWNEDGGGIRQRERYLRDADDLLASLAEVGCKVLEREPSEAMVEAGLLALPGPRHWWACMWDAAE